MSRQAFVSTPEELLRTARNFARELRPGDVVAVEGLLGAGKTTFVRGLVLELHGTDHVTSPTFTFLHEYPGMPTIRHLDLYRLEREDELAELGLEEAFTPEAIVVIEWPERAPGLIPPEARRVRIEGVGDGPRTITIE